MEAWLQLPIVYAGLAPFLAGFLVALVLYPLRVDGLAAVAGFCVTAWLLGELQFPPSSANGKLVLVVLAAAALGLLADFTFRSARTTAYILGIVFALAALWVFPPRSGRSRQCRCSLRAAASPSSLRGPWPGPQRCTQIPCAPVRSAWGSGSARE